MAEPIHFQQFQVELDSAGTPIELGRGGMGVTYKAFDTRLRRPVVLKVIRDGLLNDDTASRRFLREARSAARIQHPNIATVFDQGQQGDTFFYAMEFIEGETLQSLIKRVEKLPPTMALEITLQVTKALQAAWGEKVIHRDIKPANIMLVKDKLGGDDLLVKLIDFGLAKAAVSAGGAGGEVDAAVTTVNDAGLTAGFVGTPHFASPEQIEPTGELDIRSDIYSLGVTLWYALRGSPPFGGTSFVRVAAQHLSKPPPFEELQDAPEAVIKLLTRMLAKDRDDRPADPTELRREIEAALRSIAGSATSAPTVAPVVPPPRAPAVWPPIVGTVLAGRFEVVEHVGDDRSGRLFRANDRQRNGAPVAVRSLRPGLLGTPELRQQFQRSADLITQLQNPAIVSDVAVYEADGGRFVTMEWLESRTLMDVLRARGAALPAGEVQTIVEGLAGAADAAAGAGLESLDLTLGQVALHLPDGLPHEGWDALLTRPLAHWPRWQIKVSALDLGEKEAPPPMPEADAAMMTVIPGASSGRDALKPVAQRYTERIAALAYELLGGAPNRLDASRLALSGYTSISAVAEEGNQVLRRALRPGPSEVFASARDFSGALSVALPRRGGSATTSRPAPAATFVPASPPPPPIPPPTHATSAPMRPAPPRPRAPAAATAPVAPVPAKNPMPLIVGGVVGIAVLILAIAIFALRKSTSTGDTPNPAPTPVVANATPAPVATAAPVSKDNDPAVVGMPEPAVAVYRAVRKSESNPARAWLTVGDDYRKTCRPVEAARSFERAVQLDPNFAEAYDRLAYTSLLLARFPDAEQAARKATSLDANLPGPWRTLGITQYLTLQFVDAQQSYQRAISAAERAPQTAANLSILGDALINLSRIQAPADAKQTIPKAVDVMQRAVEMFPKDAEAWHYFGDALCEGLKFDRGVDAFNKALTLRPDYVEAMSDLGFNYSNAKQYGRGIDILTRATKINADYPIAWNNLGSAYMGNKQYPESVNAFKRAIAISPDFVFGLDGLGEAHLKNNQPRLALEPLQRATQLLPGFAGAWKNLSDAHRRLGDNAKALEEALRAVKLAPYYGEGHDMLGAAYTTSNQPEKGIVAYEKAVELIPQSSGTWNRLGVAYSRTKQVDKAMDAYRKAVKVDPENFEAWDNIGDVYTSKNQNQPAVEAYEKAVKINPKYAVGWNDLGRALNEVNQDTTALDAYQKAVALDPDFVTAWNNIGYTYIRMGLVEKSLEPLQRALKINPQYSTAWNNIAYGYNKLGRLDEAIEAYKKAVAIKPDYASAWNDLAAIYEKRGQTALAREARQNATSGAARPAASPGATPKPKNSKEFEDMLRNLEQMGQKIK
jgi:tetratricopeptide (TPR) repeat protein/serine/threonine protein kinase